MTRRLNSGFTIVEVCVATSLFVAGLALTLGGLSYTLKSSVLSDTQNELDIDVQLSIERIKRDLRLTSLEQVVLYPPGPGPYYAMSFPLARDDDADGAVDLDADGHIIWDKTLVYHVWDTVPHELRLTTFDPRDTALTEAQRTAQLWAVVTNGYGNATHNGSNASTVVVFENLFDWSVVPHGSTYDAYDTTTNREVGVSFGSCLLDAGDHELRFEVIGRNGLSGGYRVGLDSLFASPSYSEREAEALLPPLSQEGATPAVQYLSSGSWSGNHQLQFPASAVGDAFTLRVANDRWVETNFRATGEQHDGTTVEFDAGVSPSDFIVRLEGPGTNWSASLQTGDSAAGSTAVDALRGCAVRTLLRGGEMASGNWFAFDGALCSVSFEAGSAPMEIEAAYIAECVGTTLGSMDAVTGTVHALEFGGSGSAWVAAGGRVLSDPSPLAIDKEKSYLVTYLVGLSGTAQRWQESIDTSAVGAYVIPAGSSPGAADAASTTWSARGDVSVSNCVLGVAATVTRYPDRGVYTSRIFDTQEAAPGYLSLDWNAAVPGGCSLDVRVRSGNSSDMADASAWTNVASRSAPGAINPGARRYVQFQAELGSDSGGIQTPRVEDVTVIWEGGSRAVDVGGTITRGPDYGVFEVTVDGGPLTTAMRIDLEIFKDIRSFGGLQRVRSSIASEVSPRNTGR